MWTKESTYRTIVNWVKAGGTLVTAKNGFNCNEYGDVRKTDDLILSDAPGEQPFGEIAYLRRLRWRVAGGGACQQLGVDLEVILGGARKALR